MTEPLFAWLLAHAALTALVLARTGGLVWTAPALATPGLDARFRLLLAAGLALIVAPAIVAGGGDPSGNVGWVALARGLLVELVVGLALGWTAALVVAGARQAGDLLGTQAGLSAAALVDPESGAEATALGHLYGLVALGLFLALDGPLALVHALVESYRVVPAGGDPAASSLALSPATVALAFAQVGEALKLAVQAAAPVAVALTLAGLALGLISRASPSLQRAALALPLRVTLALVLILLGLVTLASTLSAAWDAWPGSLFDRL